jgi:hypothetical protein
LDWNTGRNSVSDEREREREERREEERKREREEEEENSEQKFKKSFRGRKIIDVSRFLSIFFFSHKQCGNEMFHNRQIHIRLHHFLWRKRFTFLQIFPTLLLISRKTIETSKIVVT